MRKKFRKKNSRKVAERREKKRLRREKRKLKSKNCTTNFDQKSVMENEYPELEKMYLFIGKWMRSFKFEELFLWIQTIAVHPNNQLYQVRFEVLLAVLLSIPTNEFSQKTLSREELKEFLISLDENYSSCFFCTEDWLVFSQLKPIPYFLNGKKYFFFYGCMEEPYDLLDQFVRVYFINSKDQEANELVILENILIFSLEFQSKLVEELINQEESKVTCKKIYVPTDKFFYAVSPIFTVPEGEKNYLSKHNVELLTENSFGMRDINNVFSRTVFETFALGSSGRYYYIIPQVHIEILFTIAKRTINTYSFKQKILSTIYQCFIERIFRKCAQFFAITRMIEKVTDVTGNNLLKEDVIAIVENNIFMFKAIEHDFKKDLSKNVEKALQKSQKSIEKIQKEDLIAFHYFNKQYSVFPTKTLQFWPVLVFDRFTCDAKIVLPEDFDHNKVWLVNYPDLKNIFQFLPSPLALIKFLKSDRELHQKSDLLCMNLMDRFASYISNKESYPRVGISMSFISFIPHSWFEHYHEYLFEKYQDNIHELVEKEFPDSFNYINRLEDNIYEIFDTCFLRGGRAIKFDEGTIWVKYLPDGFNCNNDEISILSNFLSPLFSDYIRRLDKPLSELFKNHNFDFYKQYCIFLCPSSYLARTDDFSFLQEYIPQLNNKNPLIVVTFYLPPKIESFVIYDSYNLPELFKSQENIGEKICIQKLVKSLYLCVNDISSETEADNYSKDFVGKHIPAMVKSYSLNVIHTKNPKLDKYRAYESLPDADISKVECEIAIFLAHKTNEKPGKYTKADAKRIIEKIFKFLQGKLETEISKHNKNILFFAYTEIELLEGHRESKRIKFGLDASKHTEYDIFQKNMEITHELSRLSIAAKYIISVILKTETLGVEAISDEKWHYLLAISDVLNNMATSYDYLHYDLADYEVKISDLYEIKIDRVKRTFEEDKFLRKESELKINSAKRSIFGEVDSGINLNTDNREREPYPFPELLVALEKAFRKQFAISFDDLISILHTLGCLDLFHKTFFPLSIVSEETLVNEIQRQLRDAPARDQIRAILRFASLDFESYKEFRELLPNHLLRQKERINICPLICLEKGKYVYGNQMCLEASYLWTTYITSADFPFKISKKSLVGETLKELHRKLDLDLEKQAEVVAIQAVGEKYVEGRIKNFQRLSKLFTKKPDCGEIDLLVVNPTLKVIFVFDAKNRLRRIRPYDIGLELRDFFKEKKSYLVKLRKKENFVTENIQEILNYFSISHSSGWQVCKAFIVNSNYLSAYVIEKDVDFVLIDELKSYLQRDVS